MTPESALLGRIADDYAEIAALRAENEQLRQALAELANVKPDNN